MIVRSLPETLLGENMCGIVGCILKDREAAPILLECVKKLEYRGYDSAGIALLDGQPGSDIAHQLLHTHYHERFPKGIR